MKGDLELRGLGRRTQEIYLSQVRDFSRYFNRSPLHLGEREIKEYLLYLIKENRAGLTHPKRYIINFTILYTLRPTLLKTHRCRVAASFNSFFLKLSYQKKT
jgi:hypothetical protein